jgi:cytochrome c biogenesis protein CcdA
VGHPEINFTSFWIGINISFPEYYARLNELNETSPPLPPALVLNRSGEILIYYSADITTQNLENWLLGKTPVETEFTIWIAFVTGLIMGISACMLLLLSVLGTSLTMVASRGKYLIISLGLIVGIIAAYLVVSIIFLVVMNALSIITYLKYIFGVVLLFLGSWQIIEFKHEKSIIFGTNPKVKSILRDFIEKKSGIYAFLLGLTFAFIKIPCFGAPYLQILFVSIDDPLIGLFIAFYLLGLLIPIVGVLLAIRIGFQSEKLNQFRLNYRPYLRLLSGCLLITLTLYLFLDTIISLDMLLWIILGEFLIFVLAIWIISRRTKIKNSYRTSSQEPLYG